jgi:hypothetical protein
MRRTLRQGPATPPSLEKSIRRQRSDHRYLACKVVHRHGDTGPRVGVRRREEAAIRVMASIPAVAFFVVGSRPGIFFKTD